MQGKYNILEKLEKGWGCENSIIMDGLLKEKHRDSTAFFYN